MREKSSYSSENVHIINTNMNTRISLQSKNDTPLLSSLNRLYWANDTREDMRTTFITKTCACCSQRWWRFCSEAHGVHSEDFPRHERYLMYPHQNQCFLDTLANVKKHRGIKGKRARDNTDGDGRPYPVAQAILALSVVIAVAVTAVWASAPRQYTRTHESAQNENEYS